MQGERVCVLLSVQRGFLNISQATCEHLLTNTEIARYLLRVIFNHLLWCAPNGLG